MTLKDMLVYMCNDDQEVNIDLVDCDSFVSTAETIIEVVKDIVLEAEVLSIEAEAGVLKIVAQQKVVMV